MTFKEYIKEAWVKSFVSGARLTAEIFKNPTSSELASIKAEDDEVRGLILPNESLLIWASTYATHEEVVSHLNLNKRDKNIPIYIFTNRELIELSEYSMRQGGISTYKKDKASIDEIHWRIDTNKYIKSLFRGYGIQVNVLY